jgi:hypothetical protein
VITGFDPDTKTEGCCRDWASGECFDRNCEFKAQVSIAAKSGQTCDFKIITPYPHPNRNCPGASSCSSSDSFDIGCGTTKEYVIKANNLTIWAKGVKCKHCERSQ